MTRVRAVSILQSLLHFPRKAGAMPARDRYHVEVKQALIKDGWTITHDPLRLKWGVKDMYVDLGAERLLAAEKGSSKIAVEIKSFMGLSEMEDLEKLSGSLWSTMMC